MSGNSFRDFLALAKQIYDEERASCAAQQGSRTGRGAWIQHAETRRAEIMTLRKGALRATPKTGFPVAVVQRYLEIVVRACTEMLFWRELNLADAAADYIQARFGFVQEVWSNLDACAECLDAWQEEHPLKPHGTERDALTRPGSSGPVKPKTGKGKNIDGKMLRII
jgi:hypothetical protein